MTKKLRLLLDSPPLFKWHRIDIVAKSTGMLSYFYWQGLIRAMPH